MFAVVASGGYGGEDEDWAEANFVVAETQRYACGYDVCGDG